MVEIVTHKTEYVGNLVAVRERRLQIQCNFLALLERTLRSGQRRGEIVHVPSAKKMAIGLHALLDGLIRNWMLEPTAFDLLAVGRAAVMRTRPAWRRIESRTALHSTRTLKVRGCLAATVGSPR